MNEAVGRPRKLSAIGLSPSVYEFFRRVGLGVDLFFGLLVGSLIGGVGEFSTVALLGEGRFVGLREE